jgi:hypothetical protein
VEVASGKQKGGRRWCGSHGRRRGRRAGLSCRGKAVVLVVAVGRTSRGVDGDYPRYMKRKKEMVSVTGDGARLLVVVPPGVAGDGYGPANVGWL